MHDMFEAIERIVRDVEAQGIMTEIENPEEGIHSLLELAENEASIVILDNPADIANAFTIGFVFGNDPHMNGVGLMLSATMSNGADITAIPRLYRKVFKYARAEYLDWVYISKRIAPSTYTGRYVKLRS